MSIASAHQAGDAPVRSVRMTVPSWCSDLPARLSEAEEGAHLPHFIASSGLGSAQWPTVWRRYLAWEINGMLRRYPGGVSVHPLTYSVLALGLRLDSKFPANELGDQSAAILLKHVLSVAARVHSDFDTPTYLPIVERPRFDFGRGFFIDYISASRALLSELFSSAVGTQGTVLDSMAVDRWELSSVLVSIDWLISNLDSSVFRRGTSCLRGRLSMLAADLHGHLARGQNSGEGDAMMREYVRERLSLALDELDYYSSNEGRCSLTNLRR